MFAANGIIHIDKASAGEGKVGIINHILRALGSSVMSDDHAKLYRIVARLRDAARQCKNMDSSQAKNRCSLSIIDELRKEAVAHFRREELLMATYNSCLSG